MSAVTHISRIPRAACNKYYYRVNFLFLFACERSGNNSFTPRFFNVIKFSGCSVTAKSETAISILAVACSKAEKSARKSHFGTQFQVVADSILRKLGTGQVCQLMRAAAPIHPLILKTGSVCPMILDCLMHSSTSHFYVSGGACFQLSLAFVKRSSEKPLISDSSNLLPPSCEDAFSTFYSLVLVEEIRTKKQLPVQVTYKVQMRDPFPVLDTMSP